MSEATVFVEKSLFTGLLNTRRWKVPNLKSTFSRRKRVCVCLQIGCPKVWREVFTDKENEAENAAQKTAAWSGVFDLL